MGHKIRVKHYAPNHFMRLFEKYATGVEFVQEKPDIIYCGSLSLLRHITQTDIPIACWVWDVPENWREWGGYEENKHRDAANRRNIERLKRCDLVIAASKFTQKTLSRHGIESQQCYFYIDTDELCESPEELKLPQVIQISRYYWNKRFEDSINAIQSTDYNLICVGTTNSKAYFNGLPRKPRVLFKQDIPRSETIRWLKRSKILVNPSIFEGFGIPQIEALYCGIPVLLRDLPVYREVYGDSVMYHSNDNMGYQLNRLIQYKQLQQKIVKDCKPIIAEFTPAKFAQRWEALITQ